MFNSKVLKKVKVLLQIFSWKCPIKLFWQIQLFSLLFGAKSCIWGSRITDGRGWKDIFCNNVLCCPSSMIEWVVITFMLQSFNYSIFTKNYVSKLGQAALSWIFSINLVKNAFWINLPILNSIKISKAMRLSQGVFLSMLILLKFPNIFTYQPHSYMSVYLY